jgi:hypothetical protein
MQVDEPFEGLLSLCEDLALALCVAACQWLSEGVSNHFSVAVPFWDDRFLTQPARLVLD